MKRKSRHKKHLELLKELVGNTDYYVAHVWNGFGISLHGDIDGLGRQRFRRSGDCCKLWFTPWLGHCPCGKIFFAVMPRTKIEFGTVLVGWKEIKWFVAKQVARKAMK